MTDRPAAFSVMDDILQRDMSLYYEAVLLAEQSGYTTRVGCIAAKGNKVIGGAFNTVRNSGKNVPHEHATFHAETNVLRMLPKPDRVTLYIARIGRTETFLASRPCNRCMKAIREFGIREIVYVNYHQRIVKELLC